MRLNKHLQLNELFETLPDIDIDWWVGSNNATVSIGDTGTAISVTFTSMGNNSYRSDFSMKDRGKANPMEIFMAAAKTIGEFIKKKKPEELLFIPFDMRRQKIYQKMLSKFVDKNKWDIVTEPSPFRKGGKPINPSAKRQIPAEKMFYIRKK